MVPLGLPAVVLMSSVGSGCPHVCVVCTLLWMADSGVSTCRSGVTELGPHLTEGPVCRPRAVSSKNCRVFSPEPGVGHDCDLELKDSGKACALG